MEQETLLHRRFKQRCSELGISLAEGARKCGKTRQAMYRILRSKNPRSTSIDELARGLDVHQSYFFEESTINQFVRNGHRANGNGGDAA